VTYMLTDACPLVAVAVAQSPGLSARLRAIRPWRRTSSGVTASRRLLLPASLREWLPGDHLAWFVIDAVAAMDLAAF
jgi:hypothetical protein